MFIRKEGTAFSRTAVAKVFHMKRNWLGRLSVLPTPPRMNEVMEGFAALVALSQKSLKPTYASSL